MAKAFGGLGVTVIDLVADLPSSPSEGMLVFQKDSNELKIYDGSVWRSMLDTDAPPATQIMSPESVTNGTNTNGFVTFSSVSSVSLNNVFTSGFPYYRIYISGLNSSGNGIAIYGRLRFNTTDYTVNYCYGGAFIRVNAAQTTWAGNNVAQFDLGRCSYSIGRNDVVLDISNPLSTTMEKTVRWTSFWDDASSMAGLSAVGSFIQQANTANGFTIYPSSGTFSGNIRVYGFRGTI